ncbi:MAG: heparinase II/III family protein [Bacteroidales bacterium]|nr:heparinase II/III family protein [Bacteroidales bacterium]
MKPNNLTLLKRMLSMGIVLLCTTTLLAQKDVLKTKYAEPGVADAFKPGAAWMKLPAYSDRAGWDALLDDDVKRQLIAAGEERLDYKWQHINATQYLEVERTGDRYVMQNTWSANSGSLSTFLLAELAEGKGRFLDQLIDAVWYYTYSPAWVYSAHTIAQRSKRALPDPTEVHIDLGAGTLSLLLAYTLHFFEPEIDKVDPVLCRELRKTLHRYIYDSYLDNSLDDVNSWLGTHGQAVNNWNPWVNSNVILSFLLVEKDNDVLHKALAKSVASVDNFLNYVQSDGACEEGPGYWYEAAAMLFDYMQILYEASEGKFNMVGSDRVKRMGEYISRAYIGGKHYVLDFADASGTGKPEFGLIWRYGKAVGSSEMQNFALLGLQNSDKFDLSLSSFHTMFRRFKFYQDYPEIKQFVAKANERVQQIGMEATVAELRREVPACTWYPQTEVGMMRTPDGCYFGVKGGYNDESHNHNDIGNFVFYVDNTPFIIDAGAPTYSRKTFSSERYTIWAMQGQWHNTPSINGVQQKDGRDYKATNTKFVQGKSRHTLSYNIGTAYPTEAACDNWNRTFTLNASRHSQLVITDSFKLTERKAADVEHFLVKGEVTLEKPGVLTITNEGITVRMTYSPTLTAIVETRVLDDQRHINVWGQTLHRISLTSSANAPATGSYQIKIEPVR